MLFGCTFLVNWRQSSAAVMSGRTCGWQCDILTVARDEGISESILPLHTYWLWIVVIHGEIESGFQVLVKQKEKDVDLNCEYYAQLFQLGEQKSEFFLLLLALHPCLWITYCTQLRSELSLFPVVCAFLYLFLRSQLMVYILHRC